ncbi:hypothetical protein [Streptacidiphilus carbonis]|uniref:hypothetical protein n=1 Tax=Streptacidiphilus carbonis TaxID=105422 RepID=UPI0005A69561|nr:hypothetical protein [Streptacidiphilus carbonis]
MSARGEVDRLTRENRELRTQLEDALREVAEVSGANGQLAAKLDERDITIRGLTEERDTAVASVEAMRIEDMEAGFTS